MLIAGLLAIYVFKEVTDTKHIIGFFASGASLVVGASLLAYFGGCEK